MASKLTVPELKERLRELGLETSGRKAELVERLEKGNGKKKRELEEDSDEGSEPVKKTKLVEETQNRRVSSRVRAREQKEVEKEKEVGEWQKIDSVLFLDSSEVKPSTLVAAFDMDDTLIKTKSGRTFAISRTDWEWLFPSIPEKLKKLHKEGFKVVIFTNQGGINGKNGYDETKASMICGKISDITGVLGFPIQGFVATTDDEYRKPATKLWDLMVSQCSKEILPDFTNVGDAAGRQDGWQEGRKKDFSCSDRKFAANIGIDFKTPEEFFLEEAAAPFDWGGFDPSTVLEATEICAGGVKSLTSKTQEMVLLVGFPAAGKSTFAKTHLIPHGYVHINRGMEREKVHKIDTLKSQEKCQSAALQALKEGKSVVIDNTNPDQEIRSKYINLAKKQKVPVRCFWLQTPKDLAQHLNYFRERLGESRHVPKVGYAVFNKNFQEPSIEEGFSEVKKVNFVKTFTSEKQKQLFNMWV